MRVRIKICGITTKEDALAASEMGVDALGFIFYPQSPRFIEATRVEKIIGILPPFVTPVGVFVDEEESQIRMILRKCHLRVLQFHGNESPAFCESFREKVIKAIRLAGTRKKNKAPLSRMLQDYTVDTFLLDTYSEKSAGGTGQAFNWDIAVDIQETLRKIRSCGRIVLSGGLTPENVGPAILKVRPYAVDVSSGVESAPGKKDHRKMRDFIRAVRSLDIGEPPEKTRKNR